MSNTAYLQLVKSTQRLLRASTDEGTWQRESEPRWYERAVCEPPSLLHDADVVLARAIVRAESVLEREAIEAEVAALAGDHDDVDALTSNLPALRVPDEHRVFARLVWLVRRWWTRKP